MTLYAEYNDKISIQNTGALERLNSNTIRVPRTAVKSGERNFSFFSTASLPDCFRTRGSGGTSAVTVLDPRKSSGLTVFVYFVKSFVQSTLHFGKPIESRYFTRHGRVDVHRSFDRSASSRPHVHATSFVLFSFGFFPLSRQHIGDVPVRTKPIFRVAQIRYIITIM